MMASVDSGGSAPSAGLEALENGCGRILQNKLRNLKKAVDKVTQLEEAVKRGETLNEQQVESMRSKETKLILIKEFDEIYKKQAALFKDEREKERRQAVLNKEKAEALAREKEEALRNEIIQKETERIAKELEEKARLDEVVMEKAEEFGPEPDEEVEEEEEAEEEYVLEEAAPLVVEATEASTDKAVMDAIRTILNVLHVADCLEFEKRSVEWFLEYFAKQRERGLPISISTEQDLRAITYFARMLTSPDGEVPIDEAVRVSTHHGTQFVKISKEEAFTGCSYEALQAMVNDVINSTYWESRSAEVKESEEKASTFMTGSIPTMSEQVEPTLNFFAHPEVPVEDRTSKMQTSTGPSLGANVPMNQGGVDSAGLDVMQSGHHMMQAPHLPMGVQYMGQHPTAGPIYSQPLHPGMPPGYIIRGPMPNYFSAGPPGVMPTGGPPPSSRGPDLEHNVNADNFGNLYPNAPGPTGNIPSGRGATGRYTRGNPRIDSAHEGYTDPNTDLQT